MGATEKKLISDILIELSPIALLKEINKILGTNYRIEDIDFLNNLKKRR